MTKDEAKKKYNKFWVNLEDFIDEYKTLPAELGENKLTAQELNVSIFWGCMRNTSKIIQNGNVPAMIKLDAFLQQFREGTEA